MDKLYTPISIKNLTETPDVNPDNDYVYLYFKNGNLTIKASDGVESQIISVTGTTVNISGDSSNNMVLSDVTGSYCLCELAGGGSSFGWSGSTSNGVGTYADSGSVCAEPNLTFDGSTLDVTGAISASGNITGATVCGSIFLKSEIVCATDVVYAGGVSASGNITGATVCATSCVYSSLVCGTSCLQSSIVCGTSQVKTPIVCTSTCVRSPVVCGVTSVQSPIVYGSTCACSQIICGVTCVIGATLCATSIIHTPIVSGSTYMCSPFICGTSSIASPVVCASSIVIAPQICGSICVCSPVICGTSCVRTATACATSIVRTATACATSIVRTACLYSTCNAYVTGQFTGNLIQGQCIYATNRLINAGLVQTVLNKCTVTTTSSTNYTYTPVARPDSCIFYCSTTNYINSCLFLDLDNYEITGSHACFHLHACRGCFSSIRWVFRDSSNVEFFQINALNAGSWNYDVDIFYNGSSFDVLHAVGSCFYG